VAAFRPTCEPRQRQIACSPLRYASEAILIAPRSITVSRIGARICTARPAQRAVLLRVPCIQLDERGLVASRPALAGAASRSLWRFLASQASPSGGGREVGSQCARPGVTRHSVEDAVG